jgi:arylsulfatase
LIVHWPAKISGNDALRTSPVHVIDIVPTVLEAVGVESPPMSQAIKAPEMHGISLMPAFTQNGAVAHEFLWWSHDGNRAIRMANWKLVADRNSPWELYNLDTDRSETKDMASTRPDKVKELNEAWNTQAEEFRRLAL